MEFLGFGRCRIIFDSLVLSALIKSTRSIERLTLSSPLSKLIYVYCKASNSPCLKPIPKAKRIKTFNLCFY